MEILKVVDSAIEGLVKIKSDVQKAVTDFNAESALLDKKEIDQIAKDKELTIREANIATIEDVIDLKATADETLKKAQDLTTIVEIDRNAFDKFVAGERKKINEALANIQYEQGVIKKENEALATREKDIKEKEQDFVAKLLAKISELK